MLAQANASSEKESIQDPEYHSSDLSISIEASHKKKAKLSVKQPIKKTLPDKKLKVFIDEIEFEILPPQRNKLLDAQVDGTKKAPQSSLYGVNMTDNKSDISSIVLHLLPFFNEKSQGNNQSSKDTELLYLELTFFKSYFNKSKVIVLDF